MITHHRMEGTICIIKTVNESFLENAADFRKTLETLFANDAIQGMIVSLQSVLMMDSSGLGTIVNFHNKLKESKKPFVLCELGKNVKEVFRLTRLDKVVKIYETEAEAIQALSQKSS